MNIEGVNLLSLAPVEGGAPSLLENGAIPDGFSNALMGQIGLLSEVNGPIELPVQLPDIGDLPKPDDEEALAVLFGNYLPAPYKKNEAVDLNETDDLEATLLTLTDAINRVFTPDEVATAQNRPDVMALNEPFFAKPLPEEIKLNKPGEENVAAGDFLQKETVLRQPIQDGQHFNLPALDNAESAKKTPALENQASVSGLEKTAPGVAVAADMVSLHRPVDNKTESPAITRPLTHPGWSKDLGEQIVWMHNKAMPSAEIKLNPAHLGPISVRIDVNQDQATIAFTAQHAEVKEAIEASIPKLREMLGAQQLNLANVNISQNSTPDQGRSHSQPFFKTPENHEQGIDAVTDTLEKNEHDRVIVSKGLLSLYA